MTDVVALGDGGMESSRDVSALFVRGRGRS